MIRIVIILSIFAFITNSCVNRQKETTSKEFASKQENVISSEHKPSIERENENYDTTEIDDDFSAIVFEQNYGTIVKDFNNDGFIDTVKSYYDGGSGFGGVFVTLINGKTKENFELDSYGCFCDIKQIILIPPELKKANNKPFLEVIKNELLPPKMTVPEASLQWLIAANVNSKGLSDNIYYDLLIKTPPQWTFGKIKLPNTYYIDIKGDTLNKLYYTDTEIPKWYNSKNNEGWLVYYGHNHFRNEKGDSLVLVDTSRNYKVFRTSHGVVLQKGTSYAWVFVTDYRLTGGPEKLRWESIGKIKLVKKHLIVQLNNSIVEKPIFIIDIENGTSGRLRCDNDNCNISYEIDNDKIIIETTENNGAIKLKSYKLEKLFNELNKLWNTSRNKQFGCATK